MLRRFKKDFFKCLRPFQVSLFYDFKNLNTDEHWRTLKLLIR